MRCGENMYVRIGIDGTYNLHGTKQQEIHKFSTRFNFIVYLQFHYYDYFITAWCMWAAHGHSRNYRNDETLNMHAFACTRCDPIRDGFKFIRGRHIICSATLNNTYFSWIIYLLSLAVHCCYPCYPCAERERERESKQQIIKKRIKKRRVMSIRRFRLYSQKDFLIPPSKFYSSFFVLYLSLSLSLIHDTIVVIR